MAMLQLRSLGKDNRTGRFGAHINFPFNQVNLRLSGTAFSFVKGKFKTNSSALNSGAAIRGGTSWFDPANSFVAVVVVSGTKLFTAKWDSDTSALTYTDRTGAVTIANANFKTFASLNDILIMAGGSASSDVLIKLTDSTANAANLSGSPPQGDAVVTVNNFLFVGAQRGSASTKSRVSWSNVSDPETWNAADFIDFRTNDGDEITALSSVGTDLIIFKNNSIGRLSTSGINVSGTTVLGPLVTVSDTIGCPSLLGVSTLPDGTLVFIGSNGQLYRFDGNTVQSLSERPYPSSINRLLSSSFVPNDLDNFFLVVYPTFSEIHMRDGLVYNYIENYWYENTEIDEENMMFVVGPRRGGSVFNSHVLCVGTTDGFVVSYDNPNRNFPSDKDGTVVSSVITFRVPINQIGFIPRFLRMYIEGVVRPANVTAEFSWDALGSISVVVPGGSTDSLQWAIPFKKDSQSKSPAMLQLSVNAAFTSGATGNFSLFLLDEGE